MKDDHRSYHFLLCKKNQQQQQQYIHLTTFVALVALRVFKVWDPERKIEVRENVCVWECCGCEDAPVVNILVTSKRKVKYLSSSLAQNKHKVEQKGLNRKR